MFGNKGKTTSKPQSRVDTLIGVGTRIDGNISFTGGLRVDGQVRGNVSAAGEEAATLVVGENARIEGEIRVTHLVINGNVMGPVHAREYVELQAKAQVEGDVFYKTLEMHPGAVIDGTLIHLGEDGQAHHPHRLPPPAGS